MSHYVTPFLVLNLGSEMVFVVAQRLQAQNISLERTNIVLDEIISVLISKQLMTELMKPQATYSHEAVREIIEDVAQSSMMRLDPISMGKLWDLITMVFKWQISVSQEILPLTQRHLYEIENYLTNPETQLQLHKVQNLVENFNKILSSEERGELREDILYWLRDMNVRVSLLLRMGLQSVDGSFITNNLNAVAEEMLNNLGENIYSATQNGKILEKNSNKPQPQETVNELQVFADQILGDRKLSSSSNDSGRMLRFSIDDQSSNNNEDAPKIAFDDINVNTEESFDELINDIEVSEKNAAGNNLKEDLLEMIGGDDPVTDC